MGKIRVKIDQSKWLDAIVAEPESISVLVVLRPESMVIAI